MVVEDDHDVGVSEGADDRVHHVHRPLALKLRVRLDGVIRNPGILFESLIGPREPNGVHAEIDNLLHDRLQRGMVEATNDVFLFIEAVPIH